MQAIGWVDLAMLGVLWFALTIPATDRFARWGMAGVVGGAIGNLIDRATTGTTRIK